MGLLALDVAGYAATTLVWIGIVYYLIKWKNISHDMHPVGWYIIASGIAEGLSLITSKMGIRNAFIVPLFYFF